MHVQHIHTRTRIHTNIEYKHAHVRMCTQTLLHAHTHIHTYIHAYIRTYIQACTHTHVHANTVHTHTHTYIHTHTNTHACTAQANLEAMQKDCMSRMHILKPHSSMQLLATLLTLPRLLARCRVSRCVCTCVRVCVCV